MSKRRESPFTPPVMPRTLQKISATLSGLLFVVCVPLFLITAVVAWAFNDPGLYYRGFQKYDVSRMTGITEADLRQVGAELRGYFNSHEEPLSVQTRVYGKEQELFNEREVLHMKDVKHLVWGVYVIALLSGLYLAGAIITSLKRRGRYAYRQLARRAVWGGGLTVGLIVLFGLFAVTGFDSLFTAFHRISFANDLWQLDPRRDYLVMLFPLGFWFDATVSVALRAIAGALALMAAGSVLLLYFSRKLGTTLEGGAGTGAT